MGVSFIIRQRGRDSLYKTWHASKDHLFMYVYSGEGAAVCGEGTFPIKPGSLIFISAGTYHYTMPDVPENYERSKINVSPDVFGAVLDLAADPSVRDLFSGKSFVFSEIPESERKTAQGVFEDIAACPDSPGKDLAVLSGLLRLLYLLCSRRSGSLPGASGVTAKAVDHINKNISFDLDVSSICRAVGVSKYHFCREFKKHTGLTVMEYVLKTRLVLAKTELLKTDLAVSRISEKCGFSSVSYFCRVFKKEEGVSPLRYRASCSNS